jgi:hypothetical protein
MIRSSRTISLHIASAEPDTIHRAADRGASAAMSDKTKKTVDTDTSAAYRLATNPFQWSETPDERNTCRAFPTT